MIPPIPMMGNLPSGVYLTVPPLLTTIGLALGVLVALTPALLALACFIRSRRPMRRASHRVEAASAGAAERLAAVRSAVRAVAVVEWLRANSRLTRAETHR